MSADLPPVGLVLGSELAPEHLGATAARAEEQGFGELWLSEDFFFTGGVAGAGVALGATSSIPVGLGVVSAMVRHPALLAMEIATLARAHPGRVRPAIGLGVPGWLDQMGLRPRSPLTAVRDTVGSVKSLLAGETLDEPTATSHYDGVALTYPLDEQVPVATGVIGPKMLQLSGEVADGTLLSVLVGTEYVRWARERIAEGAERAGRDPADHHVTAFAIYSVDEDAQKAKEAVRATAGFYLGAGGTNAITDQAGLSEELTALIEEGGVDAVVRDLDQSWFDQLTIAGEPDECADGIRRLLDAGADSVALFPVPSSTIERQTEMTARHVLPAL
jgi:5,10-methylenetetrahydromethanopterin reductase